MMSSYMYQCYNNYTSYDYVCKTEQILLDFVANNDKCVDYTYHLSVCMYIYYCDIRLIIDNYYYNYYYYL